MSRVFFIFTVVFFASLFLSFFLSVSKSLDERERIFVCEKEREFFLLFFDYGLRKRERERERERDSIIIFFFFFVDAFETHFCLVVFPERSFEYCCVLFAVAKPRLRRSKKDHHLYLVEKEEEEKRRRKREVSNKIVLFSRERRID